ncbi:MAG: adenylosuccinate lyase [Anaerolineaceae bacterium]|nr:adenylosuccinate lyase [Anaerolineaceae bacterium]
MSQYEQYLSPFSWRYGSSEMRRIWSEANKRLTWRRVWVALARVQSGFGLVTADQLAELERNQDNLDIERALHIEAEIHHDLMAELKTFAEQCPLGGGILHLGATSMDVEDNAEAIRLRQSLSLLQIRLREILDIFAGRIEQYADTPVMAFTHLQPAEPSTLGYRLAFYAQDLLEDYHALSGLTVRGKGFKGAVGTGAAYADLIGLEHMADFEAQLSRQLGLPFFPVTSQTYPRRQDFTILNHLSSIAVPLYKLAFDLRLLQSPSLGEWSEPFGERQVGSSAMPFKRNPIQSEKIDSLARALCVAPQVAWQNASHSLLERTLDDSANRRTLLPEAFLAVDELLVTARRILSGMKVSDTAIQRNLANYAPFACTERVMMAAVKAGADRQVAHERLREHALTAWAEIQAGRPNPLVAALAGDAYFLGFLSAGQIQALSTVEDYVGIAPHSARALAAAIRETIKT